MTIPSTSQPVRVAVVGACGWAGSRHARALAAAGAAVTTLVDPNPAVHHLAAEVGADIASDADGLDPENVDLVVVSLPVYLQPALCADLLGRGLRVLSEKPIAESVDQAAVLCAAPGAHDRLMVGYTLHHHPAAPLVRAWVGDAKILSISVRSVARKQAVDSWRAEPGAGGVAVVNGIHAIELVASYLPGTPAVLAASASRELYRSPVDEAVWATLRFDSGALLRLETYWSPWPFATGLNNGDWDLTLDIVARDGRLVWRNDTVEIWERGEVERAWRFAPVDLFERQALAALDFARGAPPTVGLAAALRATAIADSILDATKEATS